jgi:hypothetical protein
MASAVSRVSVKNSLYRSSASSLTVGTGESARIDAQDVEVSGKMLSAITTKFDRLPESVKKRLVICL